MRISDWSSDVCSSDLVAVQAAAVGTDLRRRRPLADVPAAEVAAAGAVAGGAVLAVHHLAARGLRAVDRVGVFRRLQCEQPVLDAPDRGHVDGRWRGAGAEGRALVALLDLAVVAVPVQLHALARLL